MLAGALYDASDPELEAERATTHRWLMRYNAALAASDSDRRTLLLERFAQVGAGVFLNFNCVILDVVAVNIGDKTQIGPAVQLLAADHPRDAVTRAAGLE